MSEQHSPKRVKPTEPPHAIMIILVGLPGSGKSTFATKLIQQSPQRFIRINQDSIKNGKRGTRDMCLKAADSALRYGINVIIDRTNVSPEQRGYFLELAASAGLDQVHCIFLNLPQKDCGSRASDRQDHEGGVFGSKAYATVGMMQKQLTGAGPPLLSEGFASILECQDDAQLDTALELWVQYSTQIHNGETNLLNLNEEWAKIKGNTSITKDNSSGGGASSGLQKLDKFFKKSTTVSGKEDKGGGASTSNPIATGASITKGGGGGRSDAFSLMMTAAKQQSSSPPKKKPATTTNITSTTRHKFGHHAALSALQRYLHNPEQLLAQSTVSTPIGDLTVLYCDSQCVIVPDKFPKSRFHILVLSRDQRLQGPLDLQPSDSALVQHMKGVGLRWARENAPPEVIVAEKENYGLSVGFHSVPSMRQLHLHVISKDYDSVCLKKKQHWNSFTTPFFLDVDWVLGQLESLSKSGCGGSSSSSQKYLDYDVAEKEALVKGEMCCPVCNTVLPKMPDVKAHVASCTGKR